MPPLLRYTPSRATATAETASSDVLEAKDVKEPEALVHESDISSLHNGEIVTAEDPDLNPGELSFVEDTSGGMGRHLGVFTCTMLIVGRIIGSAIFSTPSSILNSVGSPGASIMLWVAGFVLSFCGLFIWLELGSMFPRSGGEKVYLEAVYRKPKHLATILFAANAMILGFTASSCIVFASNILVAAGMVATRWAERGIAIGVMFFATFIHGLTPKLGIAIMNVLTVIKIVLLLFVCVAGFVVLGGGTRVKDPHAMLRNAFAGSSHSSFDYATAMFKVLNAYGGWSNVNYVLNNVKDPVRTLMIAGPLGLGICSVMMILANVAYFAAASKEEIDNTGLTVASLFFGNVFGAQAQIALTIFVALRLFSFAAYVELAKEGIPLPFGNKFWASNWPTGKSPLPGLIVHLIPSVIIILGPPPTVAYPFILDVDGYPGQIINLFVVVGLFWLRYTKPNVTRPFKVWWPFALFFLAASVFLIVAPFLRPPGGIGDTPPLPYYLYCLVGLAVLAFGVLYWAAWKIVPGWFGYEFVPRKERLSDGTVVALFSLKKIE
ncbi:hypothetical protein CERSUDRAFT_98198 [Gelatoporia subvermispora B]|uniref:Amino acid transporter n=1 Tax=Ceriporiopsis subvermispora (strain B) TaxID=914234 RepID=M2QN88_CERS8|nr:hypothetical protein CERSUDRAFT_98198 [Gelatoporia subvermispora B]